MLLLTFLQTEKGQISTLTRNQTIAYNAEVIERSQNDLVSQFHEAHGSK